MRRLLLGFVSTLVVSQALVGRLGAESRAGQPVLAPVPHPNHYIVVVDASFSTVDGRARVDRYFSTLRDFLPKMLFDGGFDGIPPADPSADLFSVVTFGIVDESVPPSAAYEELHRFRFQRDFIHPALLWRQVSRQALIDALRPKEFFRLTVQVWAEDAALARVIDERGATSANRTFVISVTDGELNGSTPALEATSAKRAANPEDLRGFLERVEPLSDAYLRSGGAMVSRDGLYIEARELTPKSARLAPSAVEALSPLESVRTSYDGPESSPTSMSLLPVLSPKFSAWLQEASSASEVKWRLQGVAVATPISLPLRVELTPAIACHPDDPIVEVTGSVGFPDPLFGIRQSAYRLTQRMRVDPAYGCTTAARIALGAATVGGFSLIAFGLVFWRERAYAPQARIAVPGVLTEIPLRKECAIDAFIRPHDGGEACRITLPPFWKQRCFLRGTRLVVSGDGAAFLESDSGELNLTLPIKQRTVSLRWTSDRPASTEFSIGLVNSLRTADRVAISFARPPQP